MALGSAAIRAGQAFVEILADDSKARAVLKGFQARMESWSTTMNQVGRAMLLPAIGIGLALRATAKVFADFEQEMSKVNARLDAADQGFEMLKKTAVELGKTTAFSATEAAKAMTNFAEAGYDSARIATVMRPAIDLASAGMLDLGEAADIIITTLNTFNLNAEQIPHVVDIIAKASIESASDVRELAQAFVYASSVASTAGMPLQDLVAVLSMLHDAGIKADIAGTSIRGILLSLTSPSKEAADTMKMLGVNVMDAQGNMLAFDKIVEQFQRSLGNMGSAQRLQVIGKIFDTRQAAAFAKLLDFGSNRVRGRIDTVFNSQGAAAEVARIQLDNLSGDLKRLRGSMESFAITVTGAVVEPLRKMIDTTRNLVLLMDAWAKENPNLIKTIATIGTVAMVAAPALIGMSVALKLVAFAFQPIFLAMTTLRVGVLLTVSTLARISRSLLSVVVPLIRSGLALAGRILTGFLVGIGAGIGKMVTSITAGIMFLIGNPITLLGVALVGIAAYVVYTSNVFESAISGMSRLWRGFAVDLLASWQIVTDAIAGGKPEIAFESIVTFFRLKWVEGTNFVTGLWDRLSTHVINVFDSASTTIAILMIDSFTAMRHAWANVVGMFNIGWDLFKELGTEALRSTQNKLAEWAAVIIAKMSGQDVNEVMETLKEDQDRAQKVHNEDPDVIARRKRIVEGNERFKKEKAGIDEDGSDAKRQMVADLLARQQARAEDEFAKADAGSEEENKLRRRLDILGFKAAMAREEAEKRAAGISVDGARDGSIFPSLDMSGIKSSVQGTFSAFAARGLGGNSGVGEKIDTTNKLLKDIKGKKGPAFS